MRMKLIIHAGWGKTGSTALQTYLSSNEKSLKEQGVFFSGLFFERCPFYQVDLPGFDMQAAPVRFASMIASSTFDTASYIVDQVAKLQAYCDARSYHTAIWSNEGIVAAVHQIGSALSRLPKSVDVEFVVYIRRQDHWLLSAYKQWGIRHKTYSGQVRSFDEWLQRFCGLADYNEVLSIWEKHIDSNRIRVRIYEKGQDVVCDFFGMFGIEQNVKSTREHPTPSSDELIFYKVVNSFYDEPHLPDEVESFLRRSRLDIARARDVKFTIDFPSPARLSEILSNFAASNAKLGRFSTGDYEVRFPDGQAINYENETLSLEAVVSAMLLSLIRAEHRIHLLESKLNDMEG